MNTKRCDKKLTQKPFLKWVGGKTQIIEKLMWEFPTHINNYHEVFLGGGSVLLAMLSYVKHKRIQVDGSIYAYDINEPLIYTYKNIQSNPNELYNKIQEIVHEFCSCGHGEINRLPATLNEAKESQENYYYWIRWQYNNLTPSEKKTIIGSAMFIFLNKTCFRGVFRVGPHGFNVPYGHYKNPEIINRDHLYEIHELMKDVRFECADFKSTLHKVETDDYVSSALPSAMIRLLM